MRIEDGDSFGQTTVMQPDITLSLVIGGKVRAPLKFTVAKFEQRMIVDSRFAADTTEVYLIEKILASCWRRKMSREQHWCCRTDKLLSAFAARDCASMSEC
ncbi:hypothetical protein OE766_18080 [Pararhizobium sp. YC-54]|uniref:hypothetical protein n=1 Tax=Pararhizobium sp. YC-54 TaxID=2986920 RepID=UPI0021F6F2AB|nr:hypothetical protein [Pararhizobium sp. YC-54]MCW0000145.1 hypothetical protein [Pararhizobium sp. YC-54]